jgi:siroheme synthase
MPGHRYADLAAELQAAGISPEIPCAIISRATTKDETIIRTTVRRLAECPPAVSPSLIVVGAVVGAAAETGARENKIDSKLDKEILQLALQHPVHELHGGGGAE